MPSPATLLPFMHDVGQCDRALRELSLMWRMIESSTKMVCAEEAAAILPTMASTRRHFDRLEGELVASLVREKAAKVLRELGTKAQYVIDILVRNLYERTADVGFLATDPQLCAFVAGSGGTRAEVRERLRAYRSKYTVYEEILLLAPDGAVLAQIDDASPVQASSDPIVAQALQRDGFVQAFRASDLRPGRRHALLYARRMLHPATGQPVGVLCLCFRFEEEMAGIFRSHRDPAARYNMLLLDDANRCIASADEDWIPVGATVPVNRQGSDAVFMFRGRQYFCSTVAAQGYQGYAGPAGWQGQVMVPLDVAFQNDVQDGPDTLDAALREGLLAHAQSFSPPLHEILSAAETIRRVVWNGQVMTAGRRDGSARLQAVLEQISETGSRSNELFASSIRDLYATVLGSSLRDSEFVSHLLVDLLDRNLYERADDCRWWALTPLLRQALGRDADSLPAVTQTLQYINDLYTVYTRILVHDAEGTIVAQSQRADVAPLDLAAARIAPEMLERVAALRDEQGYVVSPFEPTPLYDGQPTYVYHAAIRSEDGMRVVGGIALVFDAAREFTAMLRDGLAGKPETSAFFVDRAGRIVASTDPARPPGSRLEIAPELLALDNGLSASRLVAHDGAYAIMGCTASSGYREFKVSDGYRDDIVAVVCERFGPVLARQRAQAAGVTLQGAADRRNNAHEFATFFCGGALVALDIAQVREARPASALTRMRIGCPERALGILRLDRGGQEQSVWVFDLGSLVCGRPSVLAANSQVVVVEHEGQAIGLLADELHAVSSYGEGQLSPTPFAAQHRLVRGIIRANGGACLVQLLDTACLFHVLRGTEPVPEILRLDDEEPLLLAA
ncbi:chemotaxis protein CheW [Ramlibacter sp. G-1-2-2]|uniref:Chemotaxis protein CheW n=1 Tax=Ramlibacter agri TaxID=2728837 RepID=A0A848H086_9BURK|nr:chemotaxis protein CheW [Ramlibacter agri]NML44225.1 chemotaxis protein CheW [Ramlibacter agri]